MADRKKFDVAVIGGGPGGYVAAIRAVQLGAKVVLIEKDRLGGTCLNQGCIPTKALLSDAKLYERAKRSQVLRAEGFRVDMEKMVRRKNEVVRKMNMRVEFLLKDNGIVLMPGRAALVDRKTIEVDEGQGKEWVEAAKIIIATGSTSAPLPGVRVDGKVILTSTEMLDLPFVPKDLIIIGGGYIGTEFACLFHALGSRVTVVEMLPSIIPTEDDEVIRGLTTALKKKGLEILTETKVREAVVKENRAIVTFIDREGKEGRLEGEKVLVAVGRSPCTEGLGLERVGVAMNGKLIQVNEAMETSVAGIYAIGDVTGRQMLAHKASAEGIAAAENACGGRRTVDYSKIPNCIYTSPEVASVGLSEKRAKEEGVAVVVGRYPFQANGRALASGESEGFVKVVAEKDQGQILGIHILGDHATDLIGGAVISLALEATVDELGRAVQAHPTLMEAVAEACLDARREAIHLPRRRPGQHR